LKGTRYFSIFVAVLLMISILPFPLNGEENRPEDRGDGVLENAGDWLIEEGEDFHYEGKTIIVNGNLTVNGTLTLTGCMLVMNTSYSTISVYGELDFQETNVSGNSTYYYFIIYGRLTMYNSNLSGMAGSEDRPYIGGLQIYSDQVTIEGGSISYNEFAGAYITSNITVNNLTIEENSINLIVNGSSPEFLDCTIKISVGNSIFLINGAAPIFVEGVIGASVIHDDASSVNYAHRLSVHVVFDNGTAIPGVNINAESYEGDISRDAVTDAQGWIRDMILPEKTVFKSQGDKVYPPYLVSARKYELQVVRSIPFDSAMEIEIVLTGDHFGEAIVRGDFNGNGLMDLAVGVPKNTSGMETPGAVFIYLNEGDLEFKDLNEAMADLKIEGVGDTEFGSVLSSGDINGDSYDDLLVCAPKSSRNGENSGTVYFFLGGETPGWTGVGDAAFDIDGEPYSDLGMHLLTANLKKDGFVDFIIGDNQHSYVYYGTLDIQAEPSSANHTLMPGNLSSGDVNGDGFTDLIISDITGQVIHFGGPVGLSPPLLLQFPTFEGSHNRTRLNNGALTMAMIGGPLNGNFDNGWNNWTKTMSIRNKNDGHWEITTEEHGDWKVYDGSTASLGPEGGNDVEYRNNYGKNCDGKLVSDPFLVPIGSESLDFWHHAKWWNFERASESQYQDDKEDFISLRLLNNESGIVVAEKVYNQTEYGYDGEEEGRLQFDISDQQGEWLRFEIEISNNRRQSEDGLIQIDDLRILPASYYINGTFVSEWMTFEGNITSYTPKWSQQLNNGTISVKFRTDPGEDWSGIPDSASDVDHDLPIPNDHLQYRVEMTNNGSATPIVWNLSIAYLLQGQISPLYMSTDYPKLKTGDIDGDGIDDLLCHKDEVIYFHHGSTNLTQDFNISNIHLFYSGEVADFSIIDLERDGSDEVVVIGDSIRILNSTADTLWERDVKTSRVSGDTASDPEYGVYKGKIFFLPVSDCDLRVSEIKTPFLVDPGENLSVNITLGNLGMLDAVNLTLYLNITSDGYSHTSHLRFNLTSMSMEMFTFNWSVPLEEGVNYTLRADAGMEEDRIADDNHINLMVISKKHEIRISSPIKTASAHGGDELSFPIILNNTGTFESENVTLSFKLPDGWGGEYYHMGFPVDSIIVTDSVELNFISLTPADEANGDFILNLSASAASATSWIDLTGTVLRADLVVEDIVLYRGDGIKTNDTIHGVAGDTMELKIKVGNHGPTYSSSFNLTLYKEGTPLQDLRNTGLGAGESTWLSFQIILEEGHPNITGRVDSLHEIPEMDEENNNLTIEFIIKSILPVGDYNISGEVRNILSEGVGKANVTVEWGVHHLEYITDENGRFFRVLNASEYNDAMVIYINATDGNNITRIEILLFSEDGGKHLILTLNQYIVEINGPDEISTIQTGGNTTITIEVTNKGNINASFKIVPSDVPDDWMVELQDLQEGKLFLGIDESALVNILIQASDQPEYSQGYQRYFLSVFVSAEIYPEANDTFVHRVEVNPHRYLAVSVIGENTSESQPYIEQSFDLMVENLGNVKDSFIPELFGDPLENYHFNISYALLDISESARFAIHFMMPYIPSGEYTNFSVGESNEHSVNVQLSLTALDFHAVACTYPMEKTGKPGERINIPLTVTNTGNLQENITIKPFSQRTELELTSGYLLLEMEEVANYDLEIILPPDALSGDVIPLTINLTTEGNFWLNITIDVTISEMYGITLTLLDTILIPETDYTVYHYLIEAENTGNGVNTFSFKAEGTHPDLVILPDPVVLFSHEKQNISVKIIVPLNNTGLVDNYLVPMDDYKQFGDLNLRIRSYSPDLITDVEAYQLGEAYLYTLNITNNGPRFENLTLIAGLPDPNWFGSINKGSLELIPGDNDSFQLKLMAPEFKEYWGGELSLTLKSESGKSNTIILDKPPIAILGTTLPDLITIEETLIFTGSQSYWNIVEYFWDFGDGNTTNGSTVTYSYSRAGEYTLTLNVVDENNFTNTKSLIVNVENLKPIPVIITTPMNRTVEVGDPIKLDATHSTDRDGEIISFWWDLGGLDERNWPVIEHIFDLEGDYKVTLFITDNSGDTVNTTITIHVQKKSDKPDDTSPQEQDEKAVTDPISYLPTFVALLVSIGVIVIIFRKKTFIRFMEKTMAEEHEKSEKK